MFKLLEYEKRLVTSGTPSDSVRLQKYFKESIDTTKSPIDAIVFSKLKGPSIMISMTTIEDTKSGRYILSLLRVISDTDAHVFDELLDVKIMDNNKQLLFKSLIRKYTLASARVTIGQHRDAISTLFPPPATTILKSTVVLQAPRTMQLPSSSPKELSNETNIDAPALRHAVEEYKEQKENMRRYIEDLNGRCKKKYLSKNKYIPPANAYVRYVDVQDYKKHVLCMVPETTHVDRNCKPIKSAGFTLSHDGRYYTDVTEKVECDLANGIWDADAISRINKYDKGVCWTTDHSRMCGEQAEADLLRPFPRTVASLRASEAKCYAKQGCRIDFLNPSKSRYTYDCVPSDEPSQSSSQKAVKQPKKSKKDLPDFPFDHGLEQFIYDWYNQKVSGKIPPVTTQLIGIGNRCQANAAASSRSASKSSTLLDDTHVKPKYAPIKYVRKNFNDFRKLDPMNPSDADVLSEYMTDTQFEEYKTLWKKHHSVIKTYGIERYRQLYKDAKDGFNIFVRTREKNMLERDDALPQETQTIAPIETIADEDAPVQVEGDDQLVARGSAPSLPQSVVNSIMKYVAITGNPKRGMIAWHSTGSGKTCTATGVMDAFWDTDRDIIFASSLDALASNPEYKFHECGKNLFPRWQNKTMDEIAANFKTRGVRFLSFAKLSNRVVNFVEGKGDITDKDRIVDLDNSIVIIDEVHNLFRPLPTQQREYERLEKELSGASKHRKLKIVILTATPGDTVADILKLLNIVRNPSTAPIKVPDTSSKESLSEFKTAIRGLISFFDMSSDTTKFPVVHDTQQFIKVPMSQRQFAKYVEAYKAVKGDQKDYEQLGKTNQLARYWEPARKYANMFFTFEKDMNLSDFSAKIPVLLSTISRFPKEKQYVYSSFYTKMGYGGQGIVGIAKEMEKAGYKKMTLVEAQKLNKEGKLPPKGKRFALAITTEVGNQLDAILRIYNHPDNKNGELIHVLLASQGFNEGIDLKAIRHIHFFEPLITMASDKQTIGRAARYCSHAQLDRDTGEWSVTIHRYMTETPLVIGVSEEEIDALLKSAQDKAKKDKKNQELKEEIARLKLQKKDAKKANTKVANIEEFIFKESRERMKEIFTLYQCMKEAAVDCHLMKRFHSMMGSPIKCEIFN